MNNKKRLSPPVVFLLLLLLLMGAAFCEMAFGSVQLSPERIISAFSGGDHVAAVILFDLRLPRLIAAFIAGAGLATAGYVLQTVTDNELCAPNIIGVNSGAGFAVMTVMCAFPMLWRIVPAAAFVGALLTTFAVLSIAALGNRPGQKSSLVLAGVALSSMLSAGISFLSLRYPDVLSSYAAFSVGGFSGASMEKLLIPGIMVTVCFALALLIAPKISLLCLGDDTAATLGVNVRFIRTAAVIISSALCAAVVSFAGLLGFVGLIVPHIVRRIAPCSLRISLPYAAVCGAALVIFSDFVGRTLFAPNELPAGIIMAFIGAPFFIYLLIRRRKENA